MRLQDAARPVADLLPDLVALRRDLHAHPELAYQERRTAGIVAQSLRLLGLEVHEGIGGTGVVGTLRMGSGPRSGPACRPAQHHRVAAHRPRRIGRALRHAHRGGPEPQRAARRGAHHGHGAQLRPRGAGPDRGGAACRLPGHRAGERHHGGGGLPALLPGHHQHGPRGRAGTGGRGRHRPAGGGGAARGVHVGGFRVHAAAQTGRVSLAGAGAGGSGA